MEDSKLKIMKRIFPVFLIALMFACGQNNSSEEEILDANPYLIGEWTGAGGFLDRDLAHTMGEVAIEIKISSDDPISAKIGEAHLQDIELSKASYGIDLKGALDKKIKDGIDFDKDHVIFLLVLPDGNLKDLKLIDANFHAKTNYFFDFNMKVGGVMLRKQ